ncbi:MAG: aminotransferase class IV [Croceivirga sp.]
MEEREPIHALYALKGNCDDVLIVKQGHITDSSYANIIFWDGKTWYTPSTYLLKGTKRSQLLHDGLIRETPIELNDLERYQGFQLINAMLDFNPRDVLPISNIKR